MMAESAFSYHARLVGIAPGELIRCRRRRTRRLGRLDAGGGDAGDHCGFVAPLRPDIGLMPIEADHAVGLALQTCLIQFVSAVRTRVLTQPTTNTQIRIVQRYTLRRLEHRLGCHRADGDAGGICTMIAHHRHRCMHRIGENALSLQQEIQPVMTLATSPGTGVVFGLAGKGACTATDTPLQVDDHSKLCHQFTPSICATGVMLSRP